MYISGKSKIVLRFKTGALFLIFQKCTFRKNTKSQITEGNANFSAAPKSKSAFVKIKKSTHPLLKTDGLKRMYICFFLLQRTFFGNVQYISGKSKKCSDIFLKKYIG